MDNPHNSSILKDVMISYSRNDKEFVSDLDEEFQLNNIDAWIDHRDIKPGYPWRDEIFKAIINSKYIIICLSPNYIESEMCRMEIFLAQCYNKKILPIMIDMECWNECKKYRELSGMSNLSVVNFVNNQIFGLPITKENQINKLISTIKKKEHKKNLDNLVYISYKSENAEYATKVADDLKKHNVNTWIASREYNVGENWQQSQWKALMNAKVLIVILNENVANSNYIRNEVLVAITRNLPILPVLIKEKSKTSVDFSRLISSSLNDANNFEMRWLNDINWFYPNKPNYLTMINELKKTISEFNSQD